MSMVESSGSGTRHDTSTIPVVDLAAFLEGNDADRRRIASHIDETCRSIGFLIVENHGVSQNVCDAAWSMAREFFDLPLAAKLALRPAESGCPRGYFPVAEESLARTRGIAAPPDRKESFSSGPLAPPSGHAGIKHFEFFYGANAWPDEPAGFREAWIDYYRAMERLGSQLMHMLACALQMADDYFVEFHTHHLSALRALNYPPSTAANLPGQQRAGAHSDYGSVTILNPDPDVGGLQVQLPSGEWITAPVLANSFIVNIGDLMARWTNGRWLSTLHRVLDPEHPAGETVPRRQSIAYFMNPNYDAEIGAIPTCLRQGEKPVHSPAQAGEYLIQQFRSAI